ncbi:MAG TPA: hypothetical protein VMT89_08090, partial [Candidatus Acidoferrales bacterium]|nr:hypothetical protein [Candidatus Acidoferrales bacterium]
MSAEARVCAAAIARWVAWFTLCFALAAAEHGAEAACNLIPQTTKVFEGAVGSMNRPFAAPGEPVDLRVRPCDTASAGLNASDLVTVVFTPPSGVKHAVVLTGAPTCAAVTPLLAACAAQLGSSGAATCVPSASSALQVIDDGSGRRLRFNFPSASVCSGGSDDQMFCGSDAECPGGACELDSTHTRTLSGPATIVVTPSNSPSLPCDLATTRCAARTGGHCNVTTSQACTPATQSTTCPSGESCLLDVTACLDDFFATDGSCATRTAQGTFNHFTALPVPNDFSSDCFTNPSVCTATATEMRVTTDSDGNVLMPMNWQGILVPSSIPVPRLLRAAIAPLVPLQLPGTSFVSSLTPEGGPLAPIFVPQFDPGAPTGVLNLFGSADAPYTILRIARRSQTFQQCSNSGFNAGLPCNGPDDCPGACIGGSTPNARCVVDGDCAGGGTCGPPGTCGQTACFGGSKNGQPCNGDANCPGGECGPALFNVASFGTAGGTGPLVIARSGPPGICEDSVGVCSSTCEPVTCNGSCTTGQCVQFAFTAEDPVNLQSLATNTQDVFAFSVEESVDGVDRNGDGDALDSVVTMRDRTTGTTQPLGAPSGCGTFVPATPAGRALVDLHESGQKFPAVSTEGDIVAFLEAEEAENGCDENGDFDHADAIVRVFKLGGTELTSATTVADSGLVIDKQNIEVSNGIVYYRHSEGGQSASQIDRASLATDGSQPDADCSGGNGSPSLSADGRFVGFSSFATTLLGPGGDTNGLSDAFVHDRCISNGGIVPGCTPSTEIVSLTADPTPLQGNGGSGAPRLSADGRFVVFGSSASNLVPGDTDGFGDIFLRDRCLSNGTVVADCTPTTERVSLRTDGTQATVDPGLGQGNYDRVVSDDGRFVVFGGNPNGMVAGSSSAIPNVFVRDRCLSKGVPVAGCTTRTIRVVVPVGGGEATGASGGFSISGNGRYIAFNSNDPNLVPCPPAPAVCDAGGTSDIFVRDLETNTTEWISVTPTGGAPNNQSYGASISSDGRFVAFQSTATDIAPG